MNLLTVQELADILRVSVATIHRHVATSDLPHIRFGGIVRFEEEAVLNWVRASEQKPNVIKKRAKKSA